MKPIQTWEVQTKGQVKSNRIHSSILRLSLRQYVEPRTDITFTFILVSFTFWNLCKSSSRPCRPVPYFFLSNLICYLSLCTSAIQLMCEPCNVLQSGPRFDFLQPFFSFWNLCKSSSRPCFPVPYGPMQRLCHPAHFLLFCCKSKLFNSKENCKSQIPDSLFCFSLWATRKRKNYTTALLPSQDPLQSSTAVDLVKLHASLLVVQDVQSTWPKVRKGNPPGSTNITNILFSNYVSTKGSAITNVGKSHWQSSLQRP